MLLLTSLLLFAEISAPTIIDLDEYPMDPSLLGYECTNYGFNDAPELGLYLVAMARNFQIDIAIETGTWLGTTSIFLAHHFEKVFTAEISSEYFSRAQACFEPYSNITALLGDSAEILHQILPSIADKPALFYLDAHWYSDWPLLRELGEIALIHKDNCLLVIDDFKVPSRPEIPYDATGSDECSLNYIEQKLSEVFTDYEWFYLIPKKRDCAKFVAYPKSWKAPAYTPST